MSIPMTTHAQDAPRATKGGLAYRLALALTALALIFVGSLSALPAHAAGSWVRGVPIGGSVGWLGTWIPYSGQPVPVVYEGTAYALGEEPVDPLDEAPQTLRWLRLREPFQAEIGRVHGVLSAWPQLPQHHRGR